MRRHLPNPKLAKTHRTYTIAEAADLYGCHRGTVRLWLRQGLLTVGPKKPLLIHGTALNAFHADRRKNGKRPCGPGELYCLPCRKPKKPSPGTIVLRPLSSSSGMISATCPDCRRTMHQRVNAARLAAFDLTIAAHTDADH